MPKRNLIWVVAILAAAVVTVWVTRSSRRPNDPGHEQFTPVVETYRLIKRQYYHPTEDEDLLRGAVRGMAESLDEYSSFVPPDRVEAFNERIDGMQQGIGLELDVVEGKVVVVGSRPNSPAQRAGLRAGDRLLAVDDQPLGRLRPAEIEQLLDGEPGTTVRLTVLRTDADTDTGPERLVLTRAGFRLRTVLGLTRTREGQWAYTVDAEQGVAYLRITEFAKGTEQRFARTYHQLGQVRGLILDLRNNPGGRPESAAAVANMFLDEGVIATAVSRHEKPRPFTAHREGTFPPVPMVVLINQATASAAEVVSGALRLHHRAVLVGQRTRGKGYMQSMIHLGELGQINLTTAELYIGTTQPFAKRPDREEWGIVPHVPAAVAEEDQAELRRLRTQDEVVPSPEPETMPTTMPQPDLPHLRKLLELDRPLAEAVKLFRQPGAIEAILVEAAAAEARAARTRPAPKAPSERD